MEVLSKDTKNLDEDEKMEVYGKFYVPEYWLINPNKQTIKVFDNVKGAMKKRTEIKRKGIVPSKAIEGFSFELGDIW